MAALIKENISLKVAYSFRSLVHYSHGNVQEDMMLKKRLRSTGNRKDSKPVKLGLSI